MKKRRHQRQGAIAVLLCVLLLPLLAVLALSVDYGFLLFIRTDLQRVGDQAVLAAVRDLTPDDDGNQDLDSVRATIRGYLELNLGDDFEIDDSDIEIGRYNTNTIYTSVDLLQTGILDTVRIRLRRDDVTNNSVALYFARLLGDDRAEVSIVATGVLQRARSIGPGTGVLPFTIELKTWNHLNQGATASIYGDGRILNGSGNPIPGNWGTVDIGPNSNSTTSLNQQILNGLTQDDLDSLHQQGAIDDPSSIDSQQDLDLNGDTGLSSGLKHSLRQVVGEHRLAPIYKKVHGHGGGLIFEIVGWGAVTVVGSSFHGANNSHVTIRKAYLYDGNLLPGSDLSDTSSPIYGAYTSPALIQ